MITSINICNENTSTTETDLDLWRFPVPPLDGGDVVGDVAPIMGGGVGDNAGFVSTPPGVVERGGGVDVVFPVDAPVAVDGMDPAGDGHEAFPVEDGAGGGGASG